MKCSELERWLNLGLSASPPEAVLDHVRDCRPCAAALAAARELESLLADEPPPTAPARFTDHVMVRVAAAREAQIHAPARTGSPFSWWVRAAAEPAAVLALILAGLVLWKGPLLWASVAGPASPLGKALLGFDLTPHLGPEFSRPETLLGLALASVPAVAWASWALYRWSERLARISTAR